MPDVRRRELIALLGGAAAAWPIAARAQQPPLIGVLSPLSQVTAMRNIEGWRAGLRELGYVEERNIRLALRFAGGTPERMPALAMELVALKPDAIIAAPESSLAAVRSLTRATAGDLWLSRVCPRWRPDVLRPEPTGDLPSLCDRGRQDP